jgi:hypothetical protein
MFGPRLNLDYGRSCKTNAHWWIFPGAKQFQLVKRGGGVRMASIIIIVSILVVYYFRDVQLLAVGPADRYRYRLALYVGTLLSYTGALCVLTRSLDPGRAQSLLRSPAVWGPCLGLHTMHAVFCLWLRRHKSTDHAWLAALAPAPVFVLSLMVIAGQVSASAQFLGVAIVAPTLVTIWSLLVIASVPRATHSYLQDARFAIDFAATSSAGLVLVAPVNLLLGNLSAALWLY